MHGREMTDIFYSNKNMIINNILIVIKNVINDITL